MTDLNILKVNKLLKNAGITLNVKSLQDLKAFLNEPVNRKLDVYDEIEEIYDILMLGAGIW